jgi:hypothetical protein
MSDFLVIGGWTGRLWTPVKIVDETPEEFRIEALERNAPRSRLSGERAINPCSEDRHQAR